MPEGGAAALLKRLLEAAREGRVDAVVVAVVAVGADVHAGDSGGLTALHHAAKAGHGEVARVLVELGADVQARDKVGFMPLHLAAQFGYGEVVRALVSRRLRPPSTHAGNTGPQG